jgi:methylmalonyl-CoA mutase
MKVENQQSRIESKEKFSTAEGIDVRSTYPKRINQEHIGFGAGFTPNLRGPYANKCMCKRPWTIRPICRIFDC